MLLTFTYITSIPVNVPGSPVYSVVKQTQETAAEASKQHSFQIGEYISLIIVEKGLTLFHSKCKINKILLPMNSALN